MTQREARQLAHRIAYEVIEQALNVGAYGKHLTDEERALVTKALDAIAQRHFEYGGLDL